MIVLTLLVACMIWILILLLLKINIQAHYSFQNLASNLQFDFRILFSKIKIEINIPREMLAHGFLNILSNTAGNSQCLDESQPEEIQKKIKTRRYQVITRISRRILYRYIFSWSKFLYIKGQFAKLYRLFFRKINIYTLHAHVTIGSGDAAETALLTGAFWAAFGQMKARLYRLVTVRKDEIRYAVSPRFETEIFLCKLNCIFSLKISHIIFTAYKCLLVILKLRRIRNYE